jgi:hypothetical protein
MNMTPGTNLCHSDQRHVLAAFVHRFTAEHKPDWASKPWRDGLPYPVQFASDNDWLANTLFAVRKDGRIDERVRHCESTPTWLHNPKLRS